MINMGLYSASIMLLISLATYAHLAYAHKDADVGYLNTWETLFLLCDIQTGFNASQHFDQVVSVANILIKTANSLQMPILASEHTPNVYGKLDSKLAIENLTLLYEKNTFSMVNEIFERQAAKKYKSVILLGVDAHVCVEQTAMDLISKNINVHIVYEGVSSASSMERRLAINRLEKMGCIIETVESVIYKLLKGTTHPQHDYLVSVLEKKGEIHDFGCKIN